MSDATIKTMVYIFAAALSAYPLFAVVFSKKKRSIFIRIITAIILLLFWYVTYRYKGILDTEHSREVYKSDSLNKESNRKDTLIQKQMNTTNQFLKSLKDSFGIIKDKNGNPIMTKKYNNTFYNPQKVSIDER